VKLPRFIRRAVVSWKAIRSGEYGGMLCNWNNGQFDIIYQWKTDEGLEEAWKLVENFYDGGRDEILVAMVKQGYNKGYFVIHSNFTIFHTPIAFWHGYFTFDEAYELLKKRCRVIGTKMGYRDPGGNIDGQS